MTATDGFRQGNYIGLNACSFETKEITRGFINYLNVIKNQQDLKIITDLTQGFCRIVQGLKALGLTKYGPYNNRLMWDCMHKLRSQVLGYLVQGETNADNIAKATKLSRRTIDYQLEDLRLMRIIDTENKLMHAITHMKDI